MNDPLTAYRGRRALVLGASGFIGRWVARALSDRGAQVLAAGRDPVTVEQALGAAGASGEIVPWTFDGSQATEWLCALRPDVVFNLAGYGVDRGERDAALARLLNHELVARLVSAVDSLGGDWPHVRLVHAGSALEYGTTSGVLREDSPCVATTRYGETKLAGTNALVDHARVSGSWGIVARLFTVYGPGEHTSRLLPTLLAAARSGAEVPLSDGLQRRDFTYVEDVAEGLLRLAVSAASPGAIVNLATGVMQPVRDFALSAARVAGIPRERLRFGALPHLPEEMAHSGVSVERLKALTQWLPTPNVDVGIRRTMERIAEQ